MALPERELQPTGHDALVDTMRAWQREVGVDWQVFSFAAHDPLDEDGELMTMIAAFSSDTASETLFVSIQVLSHWSQ